MSSFLKLVIDKFIDNLIGKVICDFPGGALNKPNISNMSNFIKFICLILCINFINGNVFGQKNKIIVKKNYPYTLESTMVEIPLKTFCDETKVNPQKSFLIKDKDGNSIPWQIVPNYLNTESYLLMYDGSFENLEKEYIISSDVIGAESKLKKTNCHLAEREDFELKDGLVVGGKFITKGFTKIPGFHKPQNGFYQYEGIGWESDKVAYRLYLDSRNKIDVFGKIKNEIVLDNVGLYDYIPGKESYQHMQDWGMDIYKVANTFGLASFAIFDGEKINVLSKADSTTCKITDDGNIFSGFEITYYGVDVEKNKNDFKATISITAGSRMSKVNISAKRKFENIVTGLARHSDTKTIWSNKEKSEWQYIGVYGKQSLAKDNLGTALFYKTIAAQKVDEDSVNETVVLKPSDNGVTYYFCATWEQELNGIKNISEFEEYLNEVLNKLNNPLQISYE